MRSMKRTLLTSALAAGISLVHGPALAQFNQFFFFGDSLTDAGVYRRALHGQPRPGLGAGSRHTATALP